MLANTCLSPCLLTFYSNAAWQVYVFHLVSLLFIAAIDPTPLFKFLIFKLFLFLYYQPRYTVAYICTYKTP